MSADEKMNEMMLEVAGKSKDKLSQIQNIMEALLKTNLELSKELKEEKLTKERLPEKALVLLQGDKGDRGEDADEDFIIKEVKKQVMDEIVVPEAPTERELLDLIEPLIPEDPIVPTIQEVKQAVMDAINLPVVPTYPEIARGLETLEGDERLDYNALKNRPNLAVMGGSSTNFAIQADGVEVVSTGYNTLNFINATVSESNGVVNITVSGGASAYATIQEEGSDLTQREKINFIGPTVTAADDAINSVTTVTVDDDLSNYDNTTSQFLASGDNISELTNDAGYITSAAETLADVSSNSDDATKSIYSMTENIPVHFRWFSTNAGLYLDDEDESIGLFHTDPQVALHHQSADAKARWRLETTDAGPTIVTGKHRK
jgi:hypothetical protein